MSRINFNINKGIIWLILSFWISINPDFGQDVIVSIKALKDSNAVSLDSIFIRNETNNSLLKLGNLNQNAQVYAVNLNTGEVVASTGILEKLTKDEFSVNPSEYGIDLITNMRKSQKINVFVFSGSGQLIKNYVFAGSDGIHSIPVIFHHPGMTIIQVKAGLTNRSFKIIQFTNTSAISSVPGEIKYSQTKSLQIEGFNYMLGDRIQVIVKKGNLKSPTWYGRPANGNMVLLALPKTGAVFDMKQTLSTGAQINTISFSGVAFYSGCFYASTFYPPGKVADYFGFQYMRDNDPDEMGHNTDFLTKAAYHMMHILDNSQMQKLIDLAVAQDSLFTAYALKRFILIKAFHRFLDNDLPSGKTSLNIDSVKKISRDLYFIDGKISYDRAVIFAGVINSLTESQRDSLYKLGAIGMKVWPMPSKPTISIPKDMNTWVMSNASELFSWFLRGPEAGIYFCPERQGTYFGGFYMKDAPAVNNPGYAIDMQATANKGAFMLDSILTSSQSKEIKDIYTIVKPSLDSIVKVRERITLELRKAIAGSSINQTNILNWSTEYGDFDGMYIYTMVDQFVKVGRTLSSDQKTKLIKLRDLDNYPCKAGKVFLYSSEKDEPAIPNTDFLFK